MEDIKVDGINTIDGMLEGRVPGMIFMQNSGQLGAAPKLRVRGTSTIIGNREPLWVLDGIVLSDPVNVDTESLNDPDFVNMLGNAIAGLNPNDIEQIDVLKDASATALYGAKAGNGSTALTWHRAPRLSCVSRRFRWLSRQSSCTSPISHARRRCTTPSLTTIRCR